MPKTIEERLLDPDGRDSLVQLLLDAGVSIDEARDVVFTAALEVLLDPEAAAAADAVEDISGEIYHA
jgi:hypothetical protein